MVGQLTDSTLRDPDLGAHRIRGRTRASLGGLHSPIPRPYRGVTCCTSPHRRPLDHCHFPHGRTGEAERDTD